MFGESTPVILKKKKRIPNKVEFKNLALKSIIFLSPSMNPGKTSIYCIFLAFLSKKISISIHFLCVDMDGIFISTCICRYKYTVRGSHGFCDHRLRSRARPFSSR